MEQEECFQRGASKAHFGQSAHNYNCAIDLFQLKDNHPLWPVDWFETVVKPNLVPTLKWYGEKNAQFYELPHVEVSSWREMAKVGLISLVE